MKLVLLLTSLFAVSVEAAPQADVPRHDDVALILFTVDEADLSITFATRVRFEAGKKAGGPVGGVGMGNRQLQMTFTPVKGQASVYEIEAKWCARGDAEKKIVFVGHTVAVHGQKAMLSQAGSAGTFELEVTIEPEPTAARQER